MSATLQLNPIPGNADNPEPKAAKPSAAPTVADLVRKHIENGVDISVLTGLYLKLRNAKKDLDEQLKVKTKPLVEGMDLIESHFLSKMLEMKVDSLKNEAGTPYKTDSVTVTVADNAAFIDYILTRSLSGLNVSDAAKQAIKEAIVDSGQLALIEARASKSAVEALLEETKELPPGLNRRVEAKVNVRAS